jgi:hypothetical protein
MPSAPKWSYRKVAAIVREFRAQTAFALNQPGYRLVTGVTSFDLNDGWRTVYRNGKWVMLYSIESR